jgi:uncharacterized phiE125 gp8 family phage protein
MLYRYGSRNRGDSDDQLALTIPSLMRVLNTAPTVEPVSLSEMKQYLRLDSVDVEADLLVDQSIAPASYGIGTANGTAVDRQGYGTLFTFNVGTVEATTTVDVHIEESDDNATWNDFTGGAFTQVTAANDNDIYTKEYDGVKQYVRAVYVVANDSGIFSVSVTRDAAESADDDLVTALITAAREQVEKKTRRALITQTWNVYLEDFPGTDFFELPFGKLQSVTSIIYTDTNNDDTTMTVTTDYLVDTSRTLGRIVLPPDSAWPTDSLYPVNAINVEFVAGYGDAGTNVPEPIRTVIKRLVSYWYENRGDWNTDEGALKASNAEDAEKDIMRPLQKYTIIWL